MAARNYSPLRALNRETVLMEGSFAPNGSSALDAASRSGLGFSVARSGVGTFLVTFSDKFASVIKATAHLQLAASADSMAQVGTIDLAAKTMVISVLTAGSPADIAADANNRINFSVSFRNSAAVPVRGS